MAMFAAIATHYPLLLPYGATCLAAHLTLYVLFRHVLPSKNNAPWKADASLTAHRLVALCAMAHWCHLGFRHLMVYDYGRDGEGPQVARTLVPAGHELAQRCFGALALWDIPASLVGASGPPDILMHLHHAGMVAAVALCLGLGSAGGVGMGTHIAPIFFGVVEISSVPLQVVDLFHPKKSPHWHRFAEGTSAFARLCAAGNEVARIAFALLFLAVRGVYFPWVVAFISAPDLYAEGSLASQALLCLSMLFTLLQMYWAWLVCGQVKKALFGGAKGGDKAASKKE